MTTESKREQKTKYRYHTVDVKLPKDAIRYTDTYVCVITVAESNGKLTIETGGCITVYAPGAWVSVSAFKNPEYWFPSPETTQQSKE